MHHDKCHTTRLEILYQTAYLVMPVSHILIKRPMLPAACKCVGGDHLSTPFPWGKRERVGVCGNEDSDMDCSGSGSV